MSMSVYPPVLSDGEDAVVSFLNVPNPTTRSDMLCADGVAQPK